MTHIRCDEPAKGIPTTVDTTHATSVANASNEALWRIMLKALEHNPCCIIILESPAGYIERHPANDNKLVDAFGLKQTRFCRCKLYNMPHRKETIVLSNMAC